MQTQAQHHLTVAYLVGVALVLLLLVAVEFRGTHQGIYARSWQKRYKQPNTEPGRGDPALTQLPTDGWRMYFLTQKAKLCAKHEMPAHRRMSSFPFLSGDTFRSMADYLFDETERSLGYDWAPNDIKHGDIIFVASVYLRQWFQDRHPNIKAKYILLTHNSDASVPVDHVNGQGDFTSFLNSSNLAYWYGQNVVMQPAHPKLRHLPIGMANNRWPHGNRPVVEQYAAKAKAWDQRDITMYVSFGGTNPLRPKVIQLLRTKNITNAVIKDYISWNVWLEDMINSRFVVAPPGNGIDTHRAWESIYFGAIPILLSGPLDPMFDGMPVLIVKDYNDVTPELLENTARTLHGKLQKQQLWTNGSWALHWHEHLERVRQEVIQSTIAA